MIETQKGWVGSMLSSLEAHKIRTVQTRENVVPIERDQLTKLHDRARRALSHLVAIHAECHALMLREEEARTALKLAQQAVIEAVSEIGIRAEIVEPSNGG